MSRVPRWGTLKFDPVSGPWVLRAPRGFDKLLNCATRERGFIRIRSDNCGLNAMLAFSYKSRRVCPSCRQKINPRTRNPFPD